MKTHFGIALVTVLVCVARLAVASSNGQAPLAGPASWQPGATQSLTELVSNLGTVGFLAWYCWFVTARAIPRLQQLFERQLQRLEELHREEIRELRAGYELLVDKLLEQKQ